MKRIITASALLLLVAMLASLLCACSNTGAGSGDATTAPVAKTDAQSSDVTTADAFKDVNFGNVDFTFLAWEQSIDEYEAAEQDGDLIKDAIYKRNTLVSTTLGVNLKYIMLKGNSSAFQDFCQTATSNIMVNAHEYDALACYTRAASLLMLNGALANLMNVEYLDFTAEWWPQSLVELNTIGNKLYFASGDIATSLLYQMMFMALNNDLAAELQISGIQQLALDGGWTLDKMLETVSGVSGDLNNNEKRDNNDRYGLFAVTHPMLDIFYLGAGLRYVEVGDNGDPIISVGYSSDKSYDIIRKLQDLGMTSNNTNLSSSGYFSTTSGNASAMAEGASLLYVINGVNLQTYLRDASFNYSILCAPKYNAEQEDYYTAVGFPHSMYCIPTDASNTEMSGAVLQMLGRESYNKVTPVVFDTSFKYKYANGAGDAEMFDIIRAGVVFDLGRTFFDQLGGDSTGPVRIWRNEVYNGTTTLASSITRLMSLWTKQLSESMEKVKTSSD